jgi:hypothetical protein
VVAVKKTGDTKAWVIDRARLMMNEGTIVM